MGQPTWITPLVKQIWCVLGLLVCVVSQGIIMGFTASLLPALQAPDSPIQADIHSGSWLASVVGPAVLMGTIYACFFLDWCGRRKANLLAIIPGMVGWLIIYSAQNYLHLLIGRVLTAFTAGAVHVTALVMIGEYTSPEHRGMFLNCKTATYCLGYTVIHFLGNYMHWRTMALVALIPHFISFAMGCSYAESPAWLASKGKLEECKDNFIWLRGIDERSLEEVTQLIAAQKERLSQRKNIVSLYGKVSGLIRKFTKKDFLKPLGIITVAFVLMESSGRHYFPSYALQIMSEVLNTESLPYYYTLGIDLVITISSLISTVLVRLMKRRTLLFSTGIASLLVLACTCVYLYLVSLEILSKDIHWIIISLFIAYFFLSNLGCAPIPLALQAELLPVAHREAGCAVIGLVLCLALTLTLKATPYLLAATKVYGTFAIFGGISGAMLLILYFTLPETKDRTLQEIENYFNHGRFELAAVKDDDVPLKEDRDEPV